MLADHVPAVETIVPAGYIRAELLFVPPARFFWRAGYQIHIGGLP